LNLRESSSANSFPTRKGYFSGITSVAHECAPGGKISVKVKRVEDDFRGKLLHHAV